jgi:hypothetical protein
MAALWSSLPSASWARPRLPSGRLGQDEAVGLAFQLGLGGLVVLQGVEVLQEQQPGRLLGVVQLAGAAGVLVQDVVDVLEGLFEQSKRTGYFICSHWPSFCQWLWLL